MTGKKPTKEQIIEALERNNGNASAAGRELGVPARTMRRWVADANLSVNSTKKRKVTAQESVDGSLSPDALHISPEKLMKTYGLSEEYVPVKLDVSERDAGTATSPKVNRAISLTVEKKPDLPEPAFGGKPITIKAPKRRKKNIRNTELVVILSDYHAPFVDWDLHKASLRHIVETQPDRIIVNGDLVDFPSLGRHRKTTPHCQASASECIEAGGKILAELRAAAPDDCKIQFIPGNHDAWLSNYLLDKAGEVYDLHAYGDDRPIWSFHNLLRFEDLNIEMIGETHDYPHNYVYLTKHLVVHHGDVARKNSGASAIGSMNNKDYAEIIGHVHRQSVISKTVWVMDHKTGQQVPRIYQGGECGTMCLMGGAPDSFPTYTRLPDWAPGYMTVEIDPSGFYSIDLATWQGNKLLWRGQEW